MNQAAPIKPTSTKVLRVLLIAVLIAILGLILWQSYRIALRTTNGQSSTNASTPSAEQAATPLLERSLTSPQKDQTTSSLSEVEPSFPASSDVASTVTTSPKSFSTTTNPSPPATASSITATSPPSTTTKTEPPTSDQTTSVAVSTDSIEEEIFRLTNELRKNPTGPLKRQKNYLPADCNSTTPLSPFLLDDQVSQKLAADWSKQMGDKAAQEIAGGSSVQQAGNTAMKHRDSEEQKRILVSLGADFSTWGENIAWASGYSDETLAKVFFEGWRESDGHYCGMMNPNFTHIGVGYHQDKQSNINWATQNFYG